MRLETPEETEAFGIALGRRLRSGDVVALSGPLGVGKTALARAILTGLGHEGDVPSPTFAIVQPYDHLTPPAWHADLYRIEDPAELDEVGLSEAAVGILLVEWPERAPNSWPDALRLGLEFAEDGARCLTAEAPASWQGRWPI